jgi:YD repeat-containing protein
VAASALESDSLARAGLLADEVARRARLANGAERREIYSLAGRLRRIEEPDGSSLRFRYRADGTLDEVIHSSGERVTYGREREAGELRSVLGSTETIIRLGEGGLPQTLIQRIDGFEWTVQYAHDRQGRVTGILYPQSGDWLRFRAAAASPGGAATSIECDGRGLAVARFEGADRLTEIRCRNGTRITEDLGGGGAPGLRCIAHYDAAGRCCHDTAYRHHPGGLIAGAGAERVG